VTSVTADRLSVVKPSPSMAAKARVDALQAAGRTIVDFTLGEPDFPTPAHIVEAGVQALARGETRYTAAAGTLALRQAIAAKLERENGLHFAPTDIVVGSGAKQIIYSTFTATLNEGDEVIVPAPYWVSYPDMVALHGGKPVIVRCEAADGFKLQPEALAQAITPRTRWLVLNTPNNPTGAVYSREELQALAAVLDANPHVWLMTDEIYEHFVYGGVQHTAPSGLSDALRERTLVINGLSKAYAFTGWRVGYGAGPTVLIKALTLLMSQSTTCPSAISQSAAITALNGPQDCVHDAARTFEARRDRMVELLNAIPGIECRRPDGAFYVFPSVAGLIGRVTPAGHTLASDVDVMNFLLEDAGVATIDGLSYGLSPYLRLSFATSLDRIEAGCAAIAAAVARCTAPV
jgi:aspartate aminotransferase